MKVLIITLHGANIGNRLQNYALQKALRGYGINIYTPFLIGRMDKRRYIKRIVKSALGLCGVRRYRGSLNKVIREYRFYKCDKEIIQNKFNIDIDKRFKHDWSKYDFAITGSDQVWHNWSGDTNELLYYYLDFIPREKRIAYAASFGFESFPDKDYLTHITGLQGLNYISCREETGVELIKQAGRESLVVADPTLLINKEEWQRIQRRPKVIPKSRFMLLYFLGDINENVYQIIKTFAQEKNLEIVSIYRMDTPDYYYVNPREFLWLIDRAEFVCTDSFHGTAFSILFHKEFYTFQRVQEGFDNMFDRIKTLLGKVGLQDRVFFDEISDYLEDSINWCDVDYQLNNFVAESTKYLLNSLGMSEELL